MWAYKMKVPKSLTSSLAGVQTLNKFRPKST